MAGRQFSVSFNITGALDGSLLAALKTAANAMRGLGNAARAASAAAKVSQSGLAGLASSLNSIQAAATKFRELKRALQDTKTALATAQGNANQLATKFNKDKAAAAELRTTLEKLQRARRKEDAVQNVNRAGLKQLRAQRDELKKQIRDLGGSPRGKVPRELSGTAKGQQLAGLLSQLHANEKSLESARQSFREQESLIKAMSRGIAETQQKLREATKTANQSGNDFNNARNNASQLKASYQQQLVALQQLRSQLGAAGFNTSSFAASEARLVSEINRVNAALQRQQALLNAQQRSQQAAQDMFNAYGNFQNALQTAQTMAQPFKAAIDKATEFERVASEVKALTQMDNLKAGNFEAVERETAALRAQAKELGAATIYSATEVEQAQAYIARTGWGTQQILGSVPTFLKLAASQHMEIARTADLATNIMTAFGHTLDSVGGDADKFAKIIEHDANVFAYTTTHSNQNFEQFGEAMKYAAPVAKLFGATIEEAAMMTKFAADAGIQGSMAGTSMRQTMLRLVAPPKKATKAMEEYGITLDNANAEWQNANAVAREYGVTLDENLSPGRQFINVMKQIDANMAGASDREKLGAFSAITGINAVSGAANIFGAGAEQAENFTQLLEHCEGALDQTYDVMTDNTYGAQKAFESAWEAVQLSAGEALLGIARTGYETFAPILAGIAQFIDQHPGVVQAAAGIAAALTGIIVAAAAVKLAFAGWSFITAQMALVRAALATLADGALLGGLIGRVAALRTALFGLGGAATLGGWGALFGAIGTQAAAARTAVAGFFASLSLSSMATGAVSALGAIGTALRGAALAAAGFAFSPVGAALMALALAGMYCYQNWDKVSSVLGNIAGIVTGALASAISQVKAAFDGFTSSGGFEALSSAASALANVIGGTLVQAFAALLTIAASAVAGIIQLFADLLTVALDFGTGLSDAFAQLTNGEVFGALDALGAAGKKVSADITQLGNHAFDGFVQGAKNVQSVVSALNMPKLPSQEVTARHRVEFDANGQAQTPAPVQTAAPDTPPIDLTAAQSGLDAVGLSAQTASTGMEGIQQATDAITQIPNALQPAQDALATFPDSLTPVTDSLLQIGTEALNAAMQLQTAMVAVQMLGAAELTTMVAVQMLGAAELTTMVATQMLGAAAMATFVAIQMLGAAALGAYQGVASLGDAAATAAGQVSGLGAAVRAACSELAAAGTNAAAKVSAAAAAIPVAKNAEGGIYRKGAFLTTFAEESPEAAIPIENSKRSKGLWTQVGQMLGFLPKDGRQSTSRAPSSKDTLKSVQSANILSTKYPLPANPDEQPKKKPWYQQLGDIFKSIPDDGRRLPKVNRRAAFPRIPDIIKRPPPRRESDKSPVPRVPFPNRTTPGSIRLPRIPKPDFTDIGTPTFPTLDTPKGGLIERPDLPARDEGNDLPVINVTMNFTFNGNADEASVKRGVESAVPTIERSMAAQLRDYRREQLRRSYA